MQVLFNLFGTRGRASLVLIKYLLVDARIRKPEVNRTGECFPHLPSETIWKANLDQPGALRVPQKGKIPAVY
jgi:hypothetical protein